MFACGRFGLSQGGIPASGSKQPSRVFAVQASAIFLVKPGLRTDFSKSAIFAAQGSPFKEAVDLGTSRWRPLNPKS